MNFFKRFLKWCSLFCKLSHAFFQIMRGTWRILRLPRPLISIFGGTRLKNNDHYWHMAHTLSTRLTAHHFSVLTGGGEGIMEAANCGAIYKTQDTYPFLSMGIGVKGLLEKNNQCSQEYYELDYFFARKWLLISYSTAFIIFPGGFGTLDELSEVLTLMQTQKISLAPIILVGIEYWSDLMHWFEHQALEHGLISKENKDLLILTDDLDEVMRIIYKHHPPHKSTQ